MSQNQPQANIENLPLDLFDQGAGTAPAAPAEAAPAPVEAQATPAAPAAPAEPAPPGPGQDWLAAGLQPGVDDATGLPRRTRRLYDAFAFGALWLFTGLIFGGVRIHPRMFLLFFVALILYAGLMRAGRNRERFHRFLDGLRRRFARWALPAG